MTTRNFRRATLVALGVASALSTSAVWAQNNTEDEAEDMGVITVTGSRIRRQDFTANAPITTVDESAFTDTGTIGVETILNQLPQFVPAITQFNSAGQVDSNAVSTVGASTAIPRRRRTWVASRGAKRSQSTPL